MRQTSNILILFFSFLMGSCVSGGSEEDSPNSWDETKASASLDLFITSEFNKPKPLPIATMGWEDSLNISRDGLHIYATYIPVDFLSFLLNGDSVEDLQKYDRGPHYDIDLVTNPTGDSYPWYHSDIIYSTRATLNDDFSPWQISEMKRSTFSEGALSAVFSDSNTIDILAFTSNEEFTAQNNIKVIKNTTSSPSGNGTFITATDISGTGSINTSYIEDNPHIERMDASYLVLFFDSEDRPGGGGSHDVWYAESWDNGASWTTPLNVSSINTSGTEHQPHLYHDGSHWWLYFSAYHTDNKLAIYRSQQEVTGDWNSWGTPDIVIGSGNTAGIGDPTLTSNGDLCFIVVYENTKGTSFDRYDGDPWCAFGK